MDETGAIIQSEVSQKDKDQYSILTYIWNLKKTVTVTLYAKQKKRHRCIEQMFGLCGRRRGGIRMGNTCKSMADSLQCMTKPTTIL